MKFACPKCSTRYSITQARIPPDKTLRFACKICNGVIRLRRKVESDEARAKALSHAAGGPPSHAPTPQREPPTPPRDAMVQWFVILSGVQKGPVPGQDIVELLRHNHVDRRSYAWRDGMNDWARLGSIPEFADLANDVGDASWRLINPIAQESGEPVPPPHFAPPEETVAAPESPPAPLSEEERAKKEKKEAELAQLYEEHQGLEAETLSEAKELEAERKLVEAEAHAELERLQSDQRFFEEEEQRLRLEQERLRHEALEAEQRTLDSQHSQQAKELREEEQRLKREQEASEMSDAPPPDDDFHEILIEDERLFRQSDLAPKEELSLESAQETAEHEAQKESLTFENLFFEDQVESEARAEEQKVLDEETSELTAHQEQLAQDLREKEAQEETLQEEVPDLLAQAEQEEQLEQELREKEAQEETPQEEALDLLAQEEAPKDEALDLLAQEEQEEQVEQELRNKEEEDILPPPDSPDLHQGEVITPAPSPLEVMFENLESERHPADSRHETPPKLHGFIETSDINASSYFRTSLNSASILSDASMDDSSIPAHESAPMARPTTPAYQTRNRVITGLSTLVIAGSVILFASALNQVNEISRTSYQEPAPPRVTRVLLGEIPSLPEKPWATSGPQGDPALFPQDPLTGGSITGLAAPGETARPPDAAEGTPSSDSPPPPPADSEGSPDPTAPPETRSPSTRSEGTPEKATPPPEPEAASTKKPERKKSPGTKEEKLRKRQALRNKLLGLVPSLSAPDLDTPVDSDTDIAAPTSSSSDLLKPSNTSRGSKQGAGVSETIEQPERPSTLSRTDQKKVEDLFNDDRKREQKMTLEKPKELHTPNLPDGLTTEALLKVISSNSLSIKLCLDKALRKGEKPKGRLNIRVVIKSTGMVHKVDIEAPKMKSATMIKCTKKRIKMWRFPRFTGDPVPVEFPYLLSTGY